MVATGLVGDGHEHEKHVRPHRAVLIQDVEKLEELTGEGYALAPGILGENLTVRGLGVQRLSPGTRIRFEDGPLVELSEPRRPCYVLDQIDPRLQSAVAGRCGYLARVVEPGRVFVGQGIEVIGSMDEGNEVAPER
ncbi:MAG: MOSC domain-containing protein [Planctomycetes bacterium]|nr:MOSC domain-containing protein [Planctomycetota bacterium]